MIGLVPSFSCPSMKVSAVLALVGVVAASPAPQLAGLKGLLESLSGDDSPGEVNGDYQQVPYETIQKLDVRNNSKLLMGKISKCN